MSAIAVACGTLVGSNDTQVPSGADASAAATSSADGGVGGPDGAVDGGLVVQDAGVTLICPIGQVLCPANGLCQTACAGCTGYPIACFACDANQQNPIGTCQPDNANAFCLNGDYSSAYNGGPGKRCNCNNAMVSNCPGQNQVCVSSGGEDYCATCGEPGTNDATCKASDLKCSASSRQCTN